MGRSNGECCNTSRKENVMKPATVFCIAVLVCATTALIARADKIELKDGTQVEGIIRKVEKGQVLIEVGTQTKTFDILSVSSMDFDTPHLMIGTPRLPAQHFLDVMEAQEMVGHLTGVENAAADVRRVLDQTKKEWGNRKTISASDVPQWEAAKERFEGPLSRYQENLNDLYFHVLGKVDQYSRLTKEANQIYVGVRGIFNVGSPLVSKDLERLPLKKYVPGNWYDTIFYEGYDRGYQDAYEKYSKNPYAPEKEPPLTSTGAKTQQKPE
jgi:hypothetical protein